MNRRYSWSKQSWTDETHPIPQILTRMATAVLVTLALSAGLSTQALADSIDVAQAPTAADAPDSTPEINTSVSRDYEAAIVYLPDPETQQLEPQSVLLTTDQPVEGAVNQIMQSYEGQDMGIRGYEVEVDSTEHEAEINFNVEHPRGADVFQSLSSANQYVFIEAIRETLLTEPTYEIDEVIFMANGVALEI